MSSEAQTMQRNPIRICVLGAESTGKTTLCADLARHYGVPFVAEFGRWYTEAMPNPSKYQWRHEDFVGIALTQNRFEDDTARWIWPVLICDTNSFVTSVFEQAYLGDRAQGIDSLWKSRSYDLLLLTDPDTPFTQDATTGLRSADARGWMWRRFEQYAQESSAPSHILRGSPQDRCQQAIAAVDSVRHV